MLTFALFMSARMGIYQETVYVKYGKHPSEALFYNVMTFTAVLANILYTTFQCINSGLSL